MMNIVLDTNCLVMSIPSKSPYHRVLTDFLAGRYTLCISNEIILEYEEILTRKMGRFVASNIINAILSAKNTKRINPSIRANLIVQDIDDNKFVDCAIEAKARCIVTQDHHYNILKHISTPKVEVVNIDEFMAMLSIDTTWIN